jgi:hypothetical protein
MEQRLLERHRRRFEGWLWPMRLLVFVGTFFAWYELLLTKTPIATALLSGAALAAAAITIEVGLTAWLRRQHPREVAIWRLLIIDRLLSNAGEALADQPRAQMESSDEVRQRPRARPRLSSGDAEYVEGEAWEVAPEDFEDEEQDADFE